MNYLASVEEAIDYIEGHLDEELCSEEIARAVGYSPYHLTHIFTAVIGEPIGSYTQKRRLANACKKLLYTKQRIIDVALESGFSSSEAFSRAFKSVYGVSPHAYRKNQIELYAGAKKRLDRESLQHLAHRITIKPSFVELEHILVAGIRTETSVRHNKLPCLWQRFHEMCDLLPLSPDIRYFGICETGRTKTCITKDGDVLFSEMVGVEVNDAFPLPDGMETKIIQGGRYAVFTHEGTLSTLKNTYDYIWGSWAIFTKETLDDREDFEIYDQRFLGPHHSNSQLDIYIPVKKN